MEKPLENGFTIRKRFYYGLTFMLISAASIIGPFISFNWKYPNTQIILHPFDATKHMIHDRDYAVVFDGGSTGTRVHIFSFVINQDLKQRKIILLDENYYYIKPGLSSFAYNVSEAVLSLEPLLSQAIKYVPTLLAPQTPLILKATAGLRLLSNDSASKILNAVKSKLESLPYKGYISRIYFFI